MSQLDQARLLGLAQSLAERALALEQAERFWPLLAEELTRAFSCERATLFRAVRDRLVSCYAVGLKEPCVLEPGEGLAGRVCETRRSLIANEPGKDERFSPRIDRSSGFKTRNLLGVPLVAQDKVVGVIELINKRGGFTPADASAMEFLASQTATIFAFFAAEERHDQLSLQVLQVEKMAAIGRLAAGFTHEVRNPLTVISGYIQVLSRRLKDPKDLEALGKMERNLRRIDTLVKNMLGFSRASAATVVPVSLGGLIDQTLELVNLEAKGSGAEIVREFDPGAPEMAGNTNTLMQVFLNLISNALQAMEGRPGSRLVLRVRGASEGREVMAEVSDNGPGIPVEVQERIFEPFFTTKGKKGTGLGLSIVEGIVRNHGGRIGLSSTPGKGTTFTLVFPAGGGPSAGAVSS